MHITFLVLGIYYAIAQVLLIREFLVVFYGNEVFIAFFFASWFLWIGIGSFISSYIADRVKQSQAMFVILQFLLSLSLFLQVYIIRISRSFLDLSAAEILPLGSSVLMVFLLSFPCSMLIGMIFPIGCKLQGQTDQSATRSISSIYIFETFGGIAGGLIFSLVLAGQTGHVLIMIFLSSLLMLTLCRYMYKHLKTEFKRGIVKILFILAMSLGITGLILSILPFRKTIEDTFDRLRWEHMVPGFQFIESTNSRFQNISIGKRGDQYSVLGDGKFIASFPEEIAHAEYAAALFAQKPAAHRVLLIGGGIDGLLQEMLLYPLKHIDYVEQDEKLFNAMAAYMQPEKKSVIKDSRVTFYFIDPRRYVKRYNASVQYDLVIIMMPDPSTAHINRCYTKEFFEEINQILHPQGVLCARVLSSENYFGSETVHYSGSIYHTLRGVFSYLALSPGKTVSFFAASSPNIVTQDYAVLAQRYMHIPLQSRRFPPEGFRTIFDPERTQFVKSELEQSAHEINSDLKPITYYFNMLLWSNFSGSEWLKLLENIRRAGFWIYVIPFIIIMILRILYVWFFPNKTQEQKCNAYISIMVVGFVSMGLQMVLIFLYQSFFGYIFERIGLVTALFMVGISLGAYGAQKIAGRVKHKELFISALLVIIGLYASVIPLIITRYVSELMFYVLFLISGFFTGWVFPCAVHHYYEAYAKIGKTAGMLDSADHIGAMTGALISGSLMVPLMGIEKSCVMLGSVAIGSSFLFIQSFAGNTRKQFLNSFKSFPYWKTSWTVLTIVLIIFFLTTVMRRNQEVQSFTFKDDMLARISGSTTFSYSPDPFPHYAGYKAGTQIHSVSLSSLGPAGDVWGYAGPINLLVSLSAQGEMRHVSLLESQETPAYIIGLNSWLERYSRNEISALTGATVTIDAIQRIANKTKIRINNEILKNKVNPEGLGRTYPAVNMVTDYRLYLMVLLLGLSVWSYLTQGKTVRRGVLILNMLFFGFVMNLLITLVNAGNISVGRMPGIDSMFWLIFAGIVLAISVLFGQVFCGYICPFGALQEIFSWFNLAKAPHRDIEKRARYIKYMILAGALCMFWISGEAGWISFNPMNYMFSLSSHMGIMIIIFTGIILISSLFFVRFWCRYFCPTGALLSFFNKIELLNKYAPEKKYSSCDLGVENNTDIDCIKCNRCRFIENE
ncbi:MAG: 4Fe-4S binding protein [bacterium]